MGNTAMNAGLNISIHAPREGGDLAKLLAEKDFLLFQSTPPARGATGTATVRNSTPSFQSTPPARGATLGGNL